MSAEDDAYVGAMEEYYNSQAEFKRETKILSVLSDSEFLLYILLNCDPYSPDGSATFDMAIKAKESNSLTFVQRQQIESTYLRDEFGEETDSLDRDGDCDERN